MGFVFLLFLSLFVSFSGTFSFLLLNLQLWLIFVGFLRFFFFRGGDSGEGRGKLRAAREQPAVAVTVGGADQIPEC
jgi:hypothetical protein